MSRVYSFLIDVRQINMGVMMDNVHYMFNRLRTRMVIRCVSVMIRIRVHYMSDVIRFIGHFGIRLLYHYRFEYSIMVKNVNSMCV